MNTDRILPVWFSLQQSYLIALCKKYQVRQMALFGSIVRDDFDPNQSDLDFIVEFQAMSPAEHAQHYFDLRDSLQGLFNRTIDLVELTTLRNPYRLTQIQSEQIKLYEA